MGANQSSSKSLQIATGFEQERQQQQQKSAGKGLGESLRKKLNSSRSISKSFEKQKQRASLDGNALMQQQADPYYVSVGAKFGLANNYVSMQMAAECAKQMEFGSKSVDRMEMNSVRDGSFISAQDKQLKKSHSDKHKQGRESAATALHPTTTTTTTTTTSSSSTPFHLSRAVNTKTSSVLNNNNNSAAVAMPNKAVSVVANGRQQHQHQHQLQNNGSLQNPFSQSAAHQYQQQQPISPIAYQQPPGHQIYASCAQFDAENEQQQYYLRNLLDNEQHLQQQQQRRYKCPQQQYQYLNPNPNLSQEPASGVKPYNRSYSFGSSLTLESSKKKNKSKNALVSIFHNNPNSSNTIQLARQQHNKWPSQTDNRRSCPGSLKRLRPAAPLSAQQATYEAMRTIDMYLVRQIARSCMVSNSHFNICPPSDHTREP